MPILRCQRTNVVRMVQDPLLFSSFPAYILPDDTSFHGYLPESFMLGQQPNHANSTGKRKESDPGAQEGRERKRAAKREPEGARQQVEQAGKAAQSGSGSTHRLSRPSR